MLPLFDNKMSAMTKANWRNDQIHHDRVYMQIVCFCFGFSFKIESTLEKNGSIEYLCPSRFNLYCQFTNKAYKHFNLTSDSTSHISLKSHLKLFSYNFRKTLS